MSRSLKKTENRKREPKLTHSSRFAASFLGASRGPDVKRSACSEEEPDAAAEKLE